MAQATRRDEIPHFHDMRPMRRRDHRERARRGDAGWLTAERGRAPARLLRASGRRDPNERRRPRRPARRRPDRSPRSPRRSGPTSCTRPRWGRGLDSRADGRPPMRHVRWPSAPRRRAPRSRGSRCRRWWIGGGDARRRRARPRVRSGGGVQRGRHDRRARPRRSRASHADHRPGRERDGPVTRARSRCSTASAARRRRMSARSRRSSCA